MKRWIVLTLFFVTMAVFASGCSRGELAITDIRARPAMAGQNGAVYFVIDNQTRQDDTLLEVRGDVAETVEVHLSKMNENSVMSMEHQESVSIPARSTVEFRSGGLHVMLIYLKSELQIGDPFELTLVFQNAGEVKISVIVE